MKAGERVAFDGSGGTAVGGVDGVPVALLDLALVAEGLEVLRVLRQVLRVLPLRILLNIALSIFGGFRVLFDDSFTNQVSPHLLIDLVGTCLEPLRSIVTPVLP